MTIELPDQPATAQFSPDELRLEQACALYGRSRQLGLPVIGALGILLRAKRMGILPQVKPVVQALQRDAGFWISRSWLNEVLKLA